jgi:hypothetical protein
MEKINKLSEDLKNKNNSSDKKKNIKNIKNLQSVEIDQKIKLNKEIKEIFNINLGFIIIFKIKSTSLSINL